MINRSKTSGDSDTRHSTLKPNNRGYEHYATYGAVMSQDGSNSTNRNPNKLHINATINKSRKVEAQIDSGSAICLAGPSILNHIANKSIAGPPITITNCHNNWENTQGCYKATINVDESLHHPIGDKQISIHITNNLPSELILGTDFLKGSGAVINLIHNRLMPPEEKEAIARHINPILQEATTATGVRNTPHGNLANAHQGEHMIKPAKTEVWRHADQKTLSTRLTNGTPGVPKRSTTSTTTSDLTPMSYVVSSQYSKRESNRAQTATTSTDMGPTTALGNGSSMGNYTNQPNGEDHTELRNPKANQETPSLVNKEQTNECKSPQYGIMSGQCSRIIKRIPRIQIPQLEEFRFDNPDTSKKPIQNTQNKITTNQLEQFDTKDVEQEWNLAYRQTIIGNYGAPTSDEVNSGHTTSYHHQLENTTDQPINARGSETQAWGARVPNATATHNQIRQPTTHSAPIFMVTIRNGLNVGRSRFIRDFRNRNIQNRQLTIWNTWETSGTTTKPRAGNPLTSNCGEISKNPSRKTLEKTPTAFVFQLNDNQNIWPQQPKNQRIASTPSWGQYQPTFQSIQHTTWEGNDVSTTGLSLTTGAHATMHLGPLIGVKPWTQVGPRPNNSTQGRCSFPISTRVQGLALVQPSDEETHVMEGSEARNNQPLTENPEDTSHQRTKQHVPNKQTSPTSDKNTTERDQPLSEKLRNTSKYESNTDPIISNQEQENTHLATNTFTRRPRMTENSNRGTITLSKALLDQWMVRHGAYEQPNDPPNGYNGNTKMPRQKARANIPTTNGTSNPTTEGSPYTHITKHCYPGASGTGSGIN